MVVMSACDEGYFPLAKGMYLSLIESGMLPPGVRLAFLDLGCREPSLDWFRSQGIAILPGVNEVMGPLAAPSLGYYRAMTCRAFLPDLFPDAEVLCWIDCDTWFQDASIIATLRQEALQHPDSLLVAPEIHFTYTRVNDEVEVTRREMYGYYEALYGPELAQALHLLPNINSGFVVMHAESGLWDSWKIELEAIYFRDFDLHAPTTRHFAEQTALNKLVKTGAKARYFDPLYNYLCLWNPPFRDKAGVIRAAWPPYPPLGMLHLAGGWRHFGRTYAERGLLYKAGEYLNSHEKIALLKAFGVVAIG